MMRTGSGKVKHVAKKSLSLCPTCGKYYEGDICPKCETAEIKDVGKPRKSAN